MTTGRINQIAVQKELVVTGQTPTRPNSENRLHSPVSVDACNSNTEPGGGDARQKLRLPRQQTIFPSVRIVPGWARNNRHTEIGANQATTR